MMSNPARELHEQLSTWAQKSGSPKQVRGLSNEAALRSHLSAAENLGHIRNFLEQLDRLGRHTESYWPAWRSLTKGLFVYPGSWQGAGDGSPFTKQALATLHRLAETYDDLGATSNEHLLQHLASLDEWLADVSDLLQSDRGIGEDRRSIIAQLIEALRAAIAGKGQLDAESFSDTLRSLLSNVSSAAGESNDMPSAWRKMFNYGQVFSTNVAGNIAATGAIHGALVLANG